MKTIPSSRAASPSLPPVQGSGRGVPVAARRGFTLVELLVTISVIVVLVALFGGAISAARNGTQANTTTNVISRLDQIISSQFRRYESRSVSGTQLPAGIQNRSAARAWHIRRNMITADMPDRWSDVAYMAQNASLFTSPAQASYIATWNSASTKPTDQYGGAECLFMIVMQGGFADCLDCNGLAQLKKGDKDNDGAIEFWDDWNNPIDYILWAPGFRKSGDTTLFFYPNPNDPPDDWKDPFKTGVAVRPGLGMRPLIYSAGADGQYGLERNGEAATLSRGASPVVGGGCGNPADPVTATSGGPAAGTSDTNRADNVVNVELKGAS